MDAGNRRAVKAVLAGNLALLSWFAGAWGVGVASDAMAAEDRRDAEVRREFWEIVAGEREPSGFGARFKLAEDLEEIVDSPDTPELVSRFRGDTNAYGGASSELGFSPFQPGCGDCGPLTPSVKEKVLLIDEGQLDEVLAGEDVDDPASVPTPPGWLVFAWNLLLIPAWLLPGWVANRLTVSRYRDYPEETRLLEKLEQQCRELPRGSQEYYEVEAARLRLRDSLEESVSRGRRRASTLQHERLMRDARLTLEAMEAGQRAIEGRE